MDIKDFQKQVENWIKLHKVGYFPPLSIMAQISEEVGELARILNNEYGGRIKKSADPKSNIESEISDILFALICLANSHEIDLNKAWEKTINTRLKRDKDRYEKIDN